MNELERLIAALPRPEPSEKLDQRIDALLARQPVRRWNATMAWVATAACVGALGFYLGRQSVVIAPVPTTVTAAAPASDPPLEVAPVATNITSVPLDADQLAKFFVGPTGREGMFGKGPVTIEISKSR